MRHPFSITWANWLKKTRKELRMTRRALGAAAKIEPSYITLMERDGAIPRRDKVIAIGRALGQEETALLRSGSVPKPSQLRAIEAALETEVA